MVAALRRIEKNTSTLDHSLSQLVLGTSFPAGDWQTDTIQSIWSSKGRHEAAKSDATQSLVISPLSKDMKWGDGDCKGVILDSLKFEDAQHRESAIPKAYEETYEWIFKEPRKSANGTPEWSSFPEWLTSSSTDVYWMTGKPGAGKSTLMKYIIGNPLTKQHLRR